MTKGWRRYVKISNIGPINDIEIDLEGLTVIIGPNSSGKSTIASIIFIIKRTIERELYGIHKHVIEGYLRHGESDRYQNEIDISDNIQELELLIKQNETVNKIIPKFASLYKKCIYSRQSEGSNTFGIKFSENVTDTFQDKLTKIIRDNTNEGIIEYADDLYSIKIKLHQPEKWVDISIEDVEFNVKEIIKLIKKDREWNEISQMINGSVGSDSVLQFLSNLFANTTGKNHLLYLPPGRALISQNLNILSSLAIDNFKYSLPATLTSYLKAINENLGQKSKQSKMVEHEKIFFNQLFEGNISTSTQFKEKSIYFNQTSSNTPIERSASMIQDLVGIPIILFGNRVYNLIVEEPEAHLHPQKQLVFAKWLTAYVNHLLSEDQQPNLLITTHSPSIIGQLENIIAASEVKSPKIHELYTPEIILDKSFIRLYELTSSKENGGYNAKLIENQDDGFKGNVFGDVSKKIYDEYAKISYLIEEKR